MSTAHPDYFRKSFPGYAAPRPPAAPACTRSNVVRTSPHVGHFRRRSVLPSARWIVRTVSSRTAGQRGQQMPRGRFGRVPAAGAGTAVVAGGAAAGVVVSRLIRPPLPVAGVS